jgi:hypothetical protein
MLALKELVGKGKMVRFLCLMAGSLWYETDDGFAFPVPLSETAGATFLAEDKALLYMRFIRKYLPSATGLEAGLAKSMFSPVTGSGMRFRSFKDLELTYAGEDGVEFAFTALPSDVFCAVEPETRLTAAKVAYLAMLDSARMAA